MVPIPMVSSASHRQRTYASRLQLRRDRRQSRDQRQLVRFWMRRAWSVVLLPTKTRTSGQTESLEWTRAARGSQEDFRGHVDLLWAKRTIEPV
jgi:hypothetical protein